MCTPPSLLSPLADVCALLPAFLLPFNATGLCLSWAERGFCSGLWGQNMGTVGGGEAPCAPWTHHNHIHLLQASPVSRFLLD